MTNQYEKHYRKIQILKMIGCRDSCSNFANLIVFFTICENVVKIVDIITYLNFDKNTCVGSFFITVYTYTLKNNFS